MVITLDIPSLLLIMGVPTAATGFCVWFVQWRIQKTDKKREKEEEQRRAEKEKREKLRERQELYLVKGVNAAIALCEATAKAVQRIPDAHCNGDMKKALEYAADIKHEERDFLAEQGIHMLYD